MVLMHRIFVLVVALFCVNAYADSGKVIGGAPYEIPTWFTDSFLDVVEDAQDALDENKTVLLYFHLDGCPYCDAMLAQNTKQSYDFIDHSNLQVVHNFQNFDKPVALLFEDKDCTACTDFHQNLINRADVVAELDKYLFVRFDAYSDQTIIDFNGKKTSPRQMIKDYDLNYRPGILLFDEGENITKIDGKLYSFHFNTVLRYVSEKYYQSYLKYGDYLRARQAELLEQGIDINIVD